jgi:hypothetical protein
MTADQYAIHWATLTGRPVSEIYIPLALREDVPPVVPVTEETE